ncbi:hypothetical protein PGT21_021985 [Puccinia graminis f. sp. tritici]|uniref:Uncharacterized protein n=1 Tax=Puccinia graminis f. sp. tritici TaxID=56615 RepID=A0A5B0MM40_PUCGR|nr:hypothetical protein PGT21_021985 [Puccinia graminis f. sp. tritici]
MYTSSPGGIPPGGMASLGTGYPLGYPDIRQVWAEKRPSAAESAPAGGYPLALAGIRHGIADIRGGLSPPISSFSRPLRVCHQRPGGFLPAVAGSFW